MWASRQLDFPRGSASQLGRRGLPLAVLPAARWRVMACGGSGADVPHCAVTQKPACLDLFIFYSPLHHRLLLLSFSFGAVSAPANSCSSLFGGFVSLRGCCRGFPRGFLREHPVGFAAAQLSSHARTKSLLGQFGLKSELFGCHRHSQEAILCRKGLLR